MSNIVLEKSKDFAIRIVNLYKYLNDDKKEYVLSKQVLRSGTSIGANITEAECGFSEKDFLFKIFSGLYIVCSFPFVLFITILAINNLRFKSVRL